MSNTVNKLPQEAFSLKGGDKKFTPCNLMPDALKKEIPLLTAINRGISCTLSILLSFDKGSEYTETSGTRFIKTYYQNF